MKYIHIGSLKSNLPSFDQGLIEDAWPTPNFEWAESGSFHNLRFNHIRNTNHTKSCHNFALKSSIFAVSINALKLRFDAKFVLFTLQSLLKSVLASHLD